MRESRQSLVPSLDRILACSLTLLLLLLYALALSLSPALKVRKMRWENVFVYHFHTNAVFDPPSGQCFKLVITCCAVGQICSLFDGRPGASIIALYCGGPEISVDQY